MEFHNPCNFEAVPKLQLEDPKSVWFKTRKQDYTEFGILIPLTAVNLCSSYPLNCLAGYKIQHKNKRSLFYLTRAVLVPIKNRLLSPLVMSDIHDSLFYNLVPLYHSSQNWAIGMFFKKNMKWNI